MVQYITESSYVKVNFSKKNKTYLRDNFFNNGQFITISNQFEK